jgi:hypothetical protein
MSLSQSRRSPKSRKGMMPMAIEYFCCYHSYLEVMEQLNDTERGRLFTACLLYSKSGEVPELRGNERFVFPAFRSQIDRDIANYEEKCRKQAANAKKRWDATACDGMPTDAKHAKEKEKEKEKTKEKEKDNTITPLPPKGGAAAQAEPDLSGLSFLVQDKVKQWLAYKSERREAYKPTGLKSLVSQIRNAANTYGDAAVCSLIDTSMSNGYRGILFDRLPQQFKGSKGVSQEYANQPNQWAKDIVARMMDEDLPF